MGVFDLLIGNFRIGILFKFLEPFNQIVRIELSPNFIPTIFPPKIGQLRPAEQYFIAQFDFLPETLCAFKSHIEYASSLSPWLISVA